MVNHLLIAAVAVIALLTPSLTVAGSPPTQVHVCVNNTSGMVRFTPIHSNCSRVETSAFWPINPPLIVVDANGIKVGDVVSGSSTGVSVAFHISALRGSGFFGPARA